jgi:hypothetical protein
MLLGAASSGFGQASNTTQANTRQQKQVSGDAAATQSLSVNGLLNRPVRLPDETDFGTVLNIGFNRAGFAETLIIGDNQRAVAVPWDVVKFEINGTITINKPASRLSEMTVDPNQVPTFADPEFLRRLRDVFGDRFTVQDTPATTGTQAPPVAQLATEMLRIPFTVQGTVTFGNVSDLVLDTRGFCHCMLVGPRGDAANAQGQLFAVPWSSLSFDTSTRTITTTATAEQIRQMPVQPNSMPSLIDPQFNNQMRQAFGDLFTLPTSTRPWIPGRFDRGDPTPFPVLGADKSKAKMQAQSTRPWIPGRFDRGDPTPFPVLGAGKDKNQRIRPRGTAPGSRTSRFFNPRADAGTANGSFRLSDLLNSNVQLSDGSVFGQVRDLVFNANGQPEFLLVSDGSNQNQFVSLPLGVGSFDGQGTLRLEIARELLSQLLVDLNNLPSLADQQFVDRLTNTFGEEIFRAGGTSLGDMSTPQRTATGKAATQTTSEADLSTPRRTPAGKVAPPRKLPPEDEPTAPGGDLTQPRQPRLPATPGAPQPKQPLTPPPPKAPNPIQPKAPTPNVPNQPASGTGTSGTGTGSSGTGSGSGSGGGSGSGS